jgi:nucleotide-binding universal stress UspA family protein
MFTHMLVPLDGSEFSEQAIEPAQSLAEKYGARITLFTVIMQFPETRLQVPMRDLPSDARGQQYLEEVRATKMSTASVPVDLVVTHGLPAERIAEVVMESQADLVVMSTHGTTGTRYTLGSTAWKILQDAPCPVLLIPAHRPMPTG